MGCHFFGGFTVQFIEIVIFPSFTELCRKSGDCDHERGAISITKERVAIRPLY